MMTQTKSNPVTIPATQKPTLPPKPSRSVVYPDNIPSELKAARRWVVWRYEPNEKGDKWTKVPYIVGGGRRKAMSNTPATWGGFDAALTDYNAGAWDGIGCVYTDGDLCGIDLDHCLTPGGEVKEWARRFLLGSYTEITPSGEGLRVVVVGSWGGRRRQYSQPGGGKVEIYDGASPRYFTVTGRRWATSPAAITDGQAALDALADALALEADAAKPSKPARSGGAPSVAISQDDTDVLNHARAASNGAAFIALFDRGDVGQYAGDESRADAALCAMLAFYTRKDAAQIDRLFRRSALMREKWDVVHSDDGRTYGQMTTGAALDLVGPVYEPFAQLEAARAITPTPTPTPTRRVLIPAQEAQAALFRNATPAALPDSDRVQTSATGAAWPKTFTIPPDKAALGGLALPNGEWTRQPDGAIVVTFQTAQALADCLAATRANREGID